jgi:hypothetical protein
MSINNTRHVMMMMGGGPSITAATSHQPPSRSNNVKGPPDMGLIFGGVGIGLLVLAVVIVFIKKAKVSSYQRTTGQVIGFLQRRSRRKSRSVMILHPRVQFLDDNGQVVQFVSDIGSGGRRYTEGAEVPVLFDPTNPATAYIHSAMELHFIAFFVAIIGTICTILGIMMAFVLA